MIISQGRRYIFIHIPKTGGTSMALALEARAMKDDIMLGDTPKARNRRHKVKDTPASGRLWKHSRIRDIYGLVDQDQIDASFCFTLVRNPYDRVLSYYHWLRGQSFAHPAVTLAKASSFGAFLDDPHTEATLRNNPASSYMTDATGRDACTAYIRLEHLATDLAPLEAHLGFALDLPHVNASPTAERAQYTDQQRARVAALCAEDFARFGYSV
ncbi:sulfotransferase family 2 domain-containing protein [Cognatishimia sp. MH4019]|uniref:sulfotransferase family 2 domain-containing protein n=1 Tax=Cognatishimia sp. MH4019 TaxID=2854030 RepID=UPI001CD23672|nr:sulfotransferase family 2 domain-containing protein [Cognatishimia sp. MH4019]